MITDPLGLAQTVNHFLDTLAHYEVEPHALAGIGPRNERGEPQGVNSVAIDFMRHFDLIADTIHGTTASTSLGKLAMQSVGYVENLIRSPQGKRWLRDQIDPDSRFGSHTKRGDRFRKVRLTNWRQFDNIEIDFSSKLTVITGANGAGKTTVLSLLAPHFSWNLPLIGVVNAKNSTSHAVGELQYESGERAGIHVSSGGPGTAQIGVSLSNQQQVHGIYISSHRTISAYRPLAHIPATFSATDVILDQFVGHLQQAYSGAYGGGEPPLFKMKEALVAAAAHGYGNAAMVANPEGKAVWEGFQEILRSVLPEDLHFRGLRVRNAEIEIITPTGSFPLEAVSGGISAIIEISWQVYLRGRNRPYFTVCIDEPENHLHPELQRSVIPALMAAFPNSNFIVATHSPFVVTAVRESNVYSLLPDENGRVNSRLVTDINTSSTPDQTLLRVLGLDTTLPVWAEAEIEAILGGLPASPTANDLRAAQQSLRDVGLGPQFTAALDSMNPGERRT